MAAWDEFGDDKSTEFLISIVADRLNIDYGDVVDGLAEIHGEKKAPNAGRKVAEKIKGEMG